MCSNIELQMLPRRDFPLSGGDGLQIGATYPKSAWQDFNFWQHPAFYHSPQSHTAAGPVEIPPSAAQLATQVQKYPAGRNPRHLHFEGGNQGLVQSRRFQFFGREVGGIGLVTLALPIDGCGWRHQPFNAATQTGIHHPVMVTETKPLTRLLGISTTPATARPTH
jgi:hypothetical protein